MHGSGGVLMSRVRPALLGSLLLLGCGAPQGTGGETQGCARGQCLGELVCLSDLCVDPQWEPEPEATTGDGPPGSGDSTSSNSSSQPEGSSDDSGSGGSDAGSTSSVGGEVCGSVDVLLLIDNSLSMASKQHRVDAALPAFFDALERATGTVSHNVMVIDSDTWPFGECELTFCPIVGGCWPVWPEYVCGETMPLVCEDVLGAGVAHPRGMDAANTDCGLGGQRFTDLSDAGARERVACAARVGTSGGFELPMDAVLAAVDPDGDAGACNEGFVRGERPLLVVVVTDEEDGPEDSMGEPAQWHERLTESRDGPVFVLGLVGDHGQARSACTGTEPDSPSGAEPSPRLWEFVELFGGRGVLASVCAEDYAPAFEMLVEVLGESCES